MNATTNLQDRGSKAPRILVLGLGNLIQRDDGVGIHAIKRFRRLAPRGVLAVDAGTNIFSVFPLLERADKIIAFDVLMAGGKPGSVYILSAGEVLDLGIKGSLHGLGLVSILSMVKKPLPEVVIFAAEPEVIDWGTELSPALRAAVPRMVRAARAMTRYWYCQTADKSHRRTDLAPLSALQPLPKLC